MYGKVLGGDVTSLLLHHCPQMSDGSHTREERLIWSLSLGGVCRGENTPLGFTGSFVLGAGGGYLLMPPQAAKRKGRNWKHYLLNLLLLPLETPHPQVPTTP